MRNSILAPLFMIGAILGCSGRSCSHSRPVSPITKFSQHDADAIAKAKAKRARKAARKASK
jgi:hypothetical protein